MTLRIGSRGSPLAVTQAEWIGAELKKNHPKLDIEFIRITTSGDRDQNSSLTKIGGKGVFVKEIEDALLSKKIDLAVHSLKDVPQTLPYGLELGPYPAREDSRDAIISRFGECLRELPKGSVIGTSSPRRRAQILNRYKNRGYDIQELRGNLDTRLKKLHEGKYAAILLAVAGLHRLGLGGEITEILEPEEMMPAPGQGCLALELRSEDDHTTNLIEPLRHAESDRRARAERSFLQALGGDCTVPVGATVDVVQDQLRMRALLLDVTGEKAIRVEEKGELDSPDLVGAKCAGRLLFEGGAELL